MVMVTIITIIIIIIMINININIIVLLLLLLLLLMTILGRQLTAGLTLAYPPSPSPASSKLTSRNSPPWLTT
jgi:disulfide bond formation protein DsbB